MRPTRRTGAAEPDPADVVAAEWHHLRQDAETADWPEYRALIEAAYAEPALRRLYPYTSHWTLRFSTTTDFPFSPDIVCLEAFEGDRYSVRASLAGVTLAETTTAAAAVSLAVGQLPPPTGSRSRRGIPVIVRRRQVSR